MKNFKAISVYIVFLMLSFTVQANDDPKKALMAQLDSLQSFSSKFNQVVVDTNGTIVHQASGAITLAQPNKLRWHTTLPDEILLIADGESVYQIDYFVEQVSIVSQSSAVENNPMMLLTTKSQSDWDKFDVVNADKGFTIQAIQQGPIKTLTLIFDGNLLTEIRSVDSQEQESRLTFSDQVQNQPLPLETFTPLVPSGFIVDDQRT